MKIRVFLHAFVVCAALFAAGPGLGTAAERPNVVLIVTDDMGYGDVGFHGNTAIRTPNLDRLARDGAKLVNFYVSPVCAPTRASLLTGRYNYRTRVVDTYQGRAMMDAQEVTLAERLGSGGYRCGIFGKWHLGDCYPMRSLDQGFHESLVHRGGGIGQPSDPPGGSSYFDPRLVHNGLLEQFSGYCSDVLTDAAIRFVEAERGRPFFLYLAFNAPHVPLEVPDRYLNMYRGRDLTAAGSLPENGDVNHQETIARAYGMVTNIDDNIGRLLQRLRTLELERNTLVIFLSDNGPQQPRYNGGLRGLKGSVYQGGIRVPFVARWAGRIPAGGSHSAPVAHIDLVPTIMEACGFGTLAANETDGRSVWPVLTSKVDELPERPYFVQWHRGDSPDLGRGSAVVTTRWKAVQAQDSAKPSEQRWELYELASDPREKRDLAVAHPEVLAELRGEYEAWFRDVSRTRGFDPPRIIIGSSHENPSTLTRQDWRVAPGSATVPLGHWEIVVDRPGTYRLEATLPQGRHAAMLRVAFGGTTLNQAIKPGQSLARFDTLRLKTGPTRVEATLQLNSPTRDGPTSVGVVSLEIERIGD